MRYAIENPDGSFTIDIASNLFPEMSFPDNTPPDWFLAENGAYPVSDAVPVDAYNRQVATEPYLSDGIVYTVKAEPFDLDKAKAGQIEVINAAANAALADITSSYPDLEVSTWPQQLSDAQAYATDSQAATPILSAIAQASGQAVAVLAAVVLQKAQAYQAAAGAVVGKRLVRSGQIDAATTVEAVMAITW